MSEYPDLYGVWRRLLRGDGKPKPEDFVPTLEQHEANPTESPQCGLWRTRWTKGGPVVPVRIWAQVNGRITHEWKDGAEIFATAAGKGVTKASLADRWHWLEPVNKDDWRHYEDHGRWPGEIADVGHNSGDIPIEEEVADVIEVTKAWIAKLPDDPKTWTEPTAHEAANRRDRLTKLIKKIEEQEEAAKRPHLDALKVIRDQHGKMVDPLADLVKAIRRDQTVYLNHIEDVKAKAVAEANAKAAAEAAKNKAPPPPPITATKTQIGGQAGKRQGLRKVTTYAVENYEMVLAAVADHPDVVAAVTKVAVAQMKAGVAVPGMSVAVERVA